MRGEYLKTVEGRLKFMGVFVLAIGGLLFWRMFDIQVLKHDHYLAMAQDQQRFEKVQTAQRGKILVHDSNVDDSVYYPLAMDVKSFAVWAVPRQIKEKDKVSTELASLLSIDGKELFSKIDNDKMYIPPLKRGLSFDDAAKVKAKAIGGILVIPEYSRNYPEGSLASQVLGFVNKEGEGKYGFEGHYNDELKGKEGNLVGEKDTIGRIISLLSQKEPQNGTSYVLSIDRSVQYFVEQKLAKAITDYQADSGTVVIMDVKTGGILAMASLPTFDPNNYQTQANTDTSLFMNPAIAGTFEPGSIFKPVIMSIAMDKGLVTPETEETFGESVEVQGFTIHTAEGKAFGKETMTQVLEHSDNVGMVWLTSKMANLDLYNSIKSFGFLDRTGIDLDSEVPGYTLPIKNWQDINRATVSFGQGIAVTPIELVSAYAAIANNGKYLVPHIVDRIVHPDGSFTQIGKEEGKQVISEQVSAQMKQMLYNVVINGTAKKAKVPGFKISAKTGTAQIAKPEGGYEDNDAKLGIFNHTAAGFAPSDNPEYAMLVKLTRPKTFQYAESTAVPLFGEISNFLLNFHYRTTPTEPIE
ncbi:MAG: penicillin-binding protein 2 [Patescibacteria group bacterium]|jgi:cell division protein FtsI/penicillin-binding protein 2